MPHSCPKLRCSHLIGHSCVPHLCAAVTPASSLQGPRVMIIWSPRRGGGDDTYSAAPPGGGSSSLLHRTVICLPHRLPLSKAKRPRPRICLMHTQISEGGASEKGTNHTLPTEELPVLSIENYNIWNIVGEKKCVLFKSDTGHLEMLMCPKTHCLPFWCLGSLSGEVGVIIAPPPRLTRSSNG